MKWNKNGEERSFSLLLSSYVSLRYSSYVVYAIRTGILECILERRNSLLSVSQDVLVGTHNLVDTSTMNNFM